jgi:CRP-like cAMP-binding protein
MDCIYAVWRKVLGPPAKVRTKIRDFDPKKFLATIGEGRKVLTFPRKQTVFAQGDAADAVFYIQQGKVKLMVVSNDGKEATLGILSTGDFFGEGSLAGQTLRMGSATAMTDCELLRLDKKAMMLALHRQHTFSDLFVAYLLARNIRYEEDLVDQLFAAVWFSEDRCDSKDHCPLLCDFRGAASAPPCGSCGLRSRTRQAVSRE